MAIDFSQVKSLTIPEGEVTKIEDSGGNILWQKESNTLTVNITGAGSNPYLYVVIATRSGTTTYYSATTLSFNKSDITGIAIYHRISIAANSRYSAVLYNGELVDSNTTTTQKSYNSIDISSINRKLNIDLNVTNTDTPIAWIETDGYVQDGYVMIWRGNSTATTFSSSNYNKAYRISGVYYAYTSVTATKITSTVSLYLVAGMNRSSSPYYSIITAYGDLTLSDYSTYTYYRTKYASKPGDYKYIACNGYDLATSGVTPSGRYAVIRATARLKS